jgi:hypothetical protein
MKSEQAVLPNHCLEEEEDLDFSAYLTVMLLKFSGTRLFSFRIQF